mmetsp:Transcript_30857/g.45632  ORF Transcript_30857/g.45632 Transcript_30857/m.45632 type:complete len:90 (+) Transcript_30857:212-481(+)|eukprot:CAMPEP_0194205354 /NCGR_PEP_ID=MMETSP0156-20130528/4651_1 /TAXON_ID=33649 /ORGANISM="Thalassionema nitzschioides, Strain L26-B" /LENGTH=89 /DNA_ID=CAMNT_0038931605 /DNA_START=188 /DNA_END=457 /DNA_ORIENTATION=+
MVQAGKPYMPRAPGAYYPDDAPPAAPQGVPEVNAPSNAVSDFSMGDDEFYPPPPGPKSASSAVKYTTLVAPNGKVVLKAIDTKTGTVEC